MKSLDGIPWSRLLVESAAIVGSILLAFAIDAWWEDRKERAYEEQALSGLEAEYRLHYEDISMQIEFHELLMSGVSQLMLACSTGRYDDAEILLDDAIYASLVPVTTDLGSGVRDSLISAGKIDILQDLSLRNALSGWDRVVDEVVDGQLYSAELVRDHVFPFYKQYGIQLGYGESDKNGSPWPMSATPLSIDAENVQTLIGDAGFCTTLEYRYGHMSHTLDEYGYLLDSIEEIQTLVQASQRRGGD